MELSMRTGPGSYVVCDVIVWGYETENGHQVMVGIKPRDEVYDEVILDLSIGDTLDLIAAITSELRKE